MRLIVPNYVVTFEIKHEDMNKRQQVSVVVFTPTAECVCFGVFIKK